jgi:hypothetical protein
VPGGCAWAGDLMTTPIAAASPGPLLTPDEYQAIHDAGQLWNLLCKIVGSGPSRDGDLRELVAHIHGIQRAVMKQAAARAYPDRYRLLGDPDWPRRSEDSAGAEPGEPQERDHA